MSIQISGSIAFDTIMVFEGQFKDHILPDQVHMLNVAFLAPQMRQEFGGCAANIAYSLAGLGLPTRLLGSIGHDGQGYLARLTGLGIDTSAVVSRSDCFTAQAFITTDLLDNQITAFHPGAMNFAHESSVGAGPGLGIVSPNGKQAMVQHAQSFDEQDIPFVFDPGQAMPIFEAQELRALIARASWLAVNDYEGEMLSRKLGLPLTEIAQLLKPHSTGGVIQTKGADGVQLIMAKGESVQLPALQVDQAIDPTGCGDAFRAGLLAGLHKGFDLATSARLGVLLGGIKVQHRGGQNHPVGQNLLQDLWSKTFSDQGPCPI
ncbi:MAG: carbohydrate kinase family protein [Burkholderiaceae bacterium]